MLRSIVFDFNGVLVDDEPLHLRLIQRVLAEEGVHPSEADLFETCTGVPDRAGLTAILQGHRRSSESDVARLVARKATYYQEAVRDQGYQYFDGALELVRQAAAEGLTLGLVSGALREEVEQALLQGGVREVFKAVVTSEDVRDGKPSPEGYLRVIEQMNGTPPLPERLIHPHEVLAIEDSGAGVSAAITSGLVTLGVAHTFPMERLAEADLVTRSLATLDIPRLQNMYAEASRR